MALCTINHAGTKKDGSEMNRMNAQKKCRVACVFGTRPEVIKLAPVIFALRNTQWADVILISTGQHTSLANDMLDIFGLKADIELNVMRHNQSLGELTASLCKKLEHFLKTQSVDYMLAAGDTTSVLIASLLAFYHKIPFGHIEAGLRSFDKFQPFPEEMNRVLTAPLARWHFAPTAEEKNNLIRENIHSDNITVTGNTVIDALHWTIQHRPGTLALNQDKKIILVTAHRRENFGGPIHNICQAILALRNRFSDIEFYLPMHPNPNVKTTIFHELSNQSRIHLLSSLIYNDFVQLMQHSTLILTDSGGIQEEAPFLHKPLLVLRNTTERPAIISAGVGRLVGTDTDAIVQQATLLLTDKESYSQMSTGPSPYGDGHAAAKIIEVLENHHRSLLLKKGT
jgi:UDP-N-acetylglucosamine 2-epimerase (non-hydrolysing)